MTVDPRAEMAAIQLESELREGRRLFTRLMQVLDHDPRAREVLMAKLNEPFRPDEVPSA